MRLNFLPGNRLSSSARPAAALRCFAWGVVTAAAVHGVWPASWPYAPVLFAATGLGLWNGRRRTRLLALGLGFLITFFRFDFALRTLLTEDPALRGVRRLTGTVTLLRESGGADRLRLGDVQIIGEGARRSVAGGVLVSVERYTGLELGARVGLRCALRRPAPSFVPDNVRVREMIRAVCNDPSEIRLLTPPAGATRAFTLIRERAIGALNRALPSPHSELAVGLILGSSSSPLPAAVADAFRRTGLSHIVAVSGYNVSIVSGWLLAALLAIGLSRRPAFAVGIIGIWSYVVLTGAPPSVVRAGAMASAVAAARLLGRESRALHALLLSSAAMLLMNPALLFFDIGFELTVAATFGLVVIGPRLAEKYPRVFGRSLFGRTVTETGAAILATFPIILWRFSTMSLVAPLANILVVPAVPLSMAASAAMLPTGFLPAALAATLGLVSWLPLSYILNLTRLLSLSPFASVELGVFPWWAVVVHYLLLGWWLFAPGRQVETSALKEYEGWKVEVGRH